MKELILFSRVRFSGNFWIVHLKSHIDQHGYNVQKGGSRAYRVGLIENNNIFNLKQEKFLSRKEIKEYQGVLKLGRFRI